MRPIDAPFFPYQGGKARLRRFVCRWLDMHGHTYVEPFAGRANVFFLMLRVAEFERWVLNDLQTDSWLRHVMTYDGRPLPLVGKLEATAFMDSGSDESRWLEPLITWQGGLYTRNVTTGSRGHDLGNYGRRLTLAAEALRSAEITRRDAVELLQSLDENHFVYLDPPYANAHVASYNGAMVDRRALVQALTDAPFRWVMSEYECSDLNEAFGGPVAGYYDIFTDSNPKSPSKTNPELRVLKHEVLYSNFKQDQPHILDFQDSVRPMKVSIELIRKYGPLTWERWLELGPKHWDPLTFKAQFSRLTCLPEGYFDGRQVSLVEGDKS